MKKTISFILILLTIFFLGITIYKNENNNLSNEIVKSCSDLNYEQNLLNSKEKFGEFDIDLKISKEKKWKKILIKSQLSLIENSSFTYDPEYTPVTLVIKNKKGLRCKLLAKIKPHGDSADHFVEFKKGADKIYDLPSLKVKILDGNIFGIVEFRLFIPETRNNSNEIFASTLLQEMAIYAPRTTYVNVKYNKKKIKYIFQEKLNKEFLENNSLQEGLIFSGDERFVFKYKENLRTSKETGISKHKLSDPKFLLNNKINTTIAMKALQILNEASFFYSSKINQVRVIDYYSSQNNYFYKKYFLNVPKFDAIISAIWATHNLSRDDRRFYYDVVNKSFLPLYYDGMVNILDKNNKLVPNNKNFDLSIQNASEKKILNSAKVGSELALVSIYKIDIPKLRLILEERGLIISKEDLVEIIKTIKNNLLIIKNIPDNKLVNVSNNVQYPLKNISAVNKGIKASYLFTKKEKFIKCDLLLKNCNPINLKDKQIYLALEQKLKDNNKDDIIFMGEFEVFKETNKQETILSDTYDEVNILPNIFIKTYGKIELNIDKDLKIVDIKKNSPNGRVLFLNSILNGWQINFEDFTDFNSNINRRDINGLSGCINIYDSIIENIELNINKAVCEDGVNFVRTNGTIKKSVINNASFDGLDVDFSNISFEKTDIKNSGNDCIDFSYGVYFLDNSSFNRCGDKAISVGEGSLLESNNFKILNSNIGVASKDSSSTSLNKGYINKVKNCLSTYRKKKEFNGGYLEIKDLVCKNYESFSSIDKYSKIIEIK